MKYRKKPEFVEAIEYNGENRDDISAFVGDKKWITVQNVLLLNSSRGVVKVYKGDYIVKKFDGSCEVLYPIAFNTQYEPIV